MCDQFGSIKDEFNRELDAVNTSAQKCASENGVLKSDICALKCRLDNAKKDRDRAEEDVRALCKQIENEKNEREKERSKVCKDIENADSNIQIELKIGYESKLSKLMNNLRNQFKDKMCIASVDIVKEIVGSYPSGAAEWENEVDKERDNIDRSIETNIKQISDMQQQLTKCTTTKDNLVIAVDRHKRDHEKNVQKIRRMQQELAALLHQYQDLVDIKLLLDFELAAYNQMLVIEEYRLNVSDHCQKEEPGDQSNSTKRNASTPSDDNNSKRKK